MSSPHFKPDTAALVLIDHQVGTILLFKNIMPDTAVRNAALLSQAALTYKMPIGMTSNQKDRIQGPLHPMLQQAMCGRSSL